VAYLHVCVLLRVRDHLVDYLFLLPTYQSGDCLLGDSFIGACLTWLLVVGLCAANDADWWSVIFPWALAVPDSGLHLLPYGGVECKVGGVACQADVSGLVELAW
jgi:hypothetical protein